MKSQLKSRPHFLFFDESRIWYSKIEYSSLRSLMKNKGLKFSPEGFKEYSHVKKQSVDCEAYTWNLSALTILYA